MRNHRGGVHDTDDTRDLVVAANTGASDDPGNRHIFWATSVVILAITTADASTLEPIDPTAVAAALDADPLIDAVAVIHHETTTGLLNPVDEIAAVARQRGVPVLVDAISSFGAEELHLDGTGIDFVASTSNKCLHGLPGAAFVLVSPRGQERIAEAPARSLYFDLQNYLKRYALAADPRPLARRSAPPPPLRRRPPSPRPSPIPPPGIAYSFR